MSVGNGRQGNCRCGQSHTEKGANMDMNIFKYQAFVKTVETESFTKAAEVLNYSQSGVSRMVRDLEQEWGVTLLERSRRGVHLTSDGMQLLPYARSLCSEYEKLQMQVDDLKGVQTGIIRIGTFSSVATHWLPNIIKAFRRDYPGIDYELLMGDYTELEEWVAEGRVDCSFVTFPVREEFETIVLAKDPLLAVLPKEHPLASLEKVPLERLCDDPFLLIEKGGRAEIAQLFEDYGFNPDVSVTLWDDYAVMSMVESGLGVSILPQLILSRMPYDIVIKELDVPAFRTIAFALRSRETASVAVKRFMEYLDCRNA